MARFDARILALTAALVVGACSSGTPAGTVASPQTASPAPAAAPSATGGSSASPASPASSAACPTDQPGFAARISDLDTRLQFGGATMRMTVQTFVARFMNVNAADQVPPFAGYDPAATPVTAAAGTPIRLASLSPGLALTSADIQLWRRQDVVAADGTIRVTPGERLDMRTLTANNGTVTWAPPAGTGEYVVAIVPAWTEACMSGTGYVYLSLRLT